MLGGTAGLDTVYWRDGFIVFDEASGAPGKVTQSQTEGWAGEITIETQRGRADELLHKLSTWLDRHSTKLGAQPREQADDQADDVLDAPRPRRAGRPAAIARAAEVIDGPPVSPGREPRSEPLLYVSYARADTRSAEGPERVAVVDLLCATGEAQGIAIKRDRDDLKTGESITRFMKDIGRGDLIFVAALPR